METGLIRLIVAELSIDTTVPCWSPRVSEIIDRSPATIIETGYLKDLSPTDANVLMVTLMTTAMMKKMIFEREADLSGWNDPEKWPTEKLFDRLQLYHDQGDFVASANLLGMMFIRFMFRKAEA